MSKLKLRIGHLPIIDHLILGLTKNKVENNPDFLKHSEIETRQMFGWNEVGDSLINGEIDIAFMLAPYAMDLYHSNKNIKLVLLSHRDGSVIVTNKRANIETIEDFKNKTVLIPYQASVHHMIFHKLMRAHGLSVGIGKDITTEVVAPGQIPMMIEYDQEGCIAGYIVAEPFGTQVVNAGFGNVLKLSREIWNDHPCCSIVVRDEIIQNHPEALQELINSFVKSGFEVKQDLSNTIAVASGFLGQSEEVVRTILGSSEDRVSTDKLMPNLQELEEIQKYLMDEVSSPVLSGKIDVEKFVDLRFARAAGAL